MTVKVHLRDVRHEDDIETCTVSYHKDGNLWLDSVKGEDGRSLEIDAISNDNYDKIIFAVQHPSEHQ